MDTNSIFNLALKMAMQADLRGEASLKKLLERKKEKYEKLDSKAKEDFDLEALDNPYLDSRVLFINQGAENKEVKKVMLGIDITPAELLIAKQIVAADLVISHHPLGKGLANLADVMHLQAEVLALYGVPINIAEGLMKERISEVSRGVNSANHQRTVDAAKLLGINLICLHTVLDNLAARFLKEKVEQNDTLETVGDLLSFLNEIPEYKEANKIGAGPKVFAGSEERKTGKIAITEITGGTEGSSKLYEKMAQSGIGTVIGMHQSEEHRKEAEKANVNMVIAGHMSSDSIGCNLFLDKLEEKGIEIIPCSGLIRVSRS
ncbi:Nif3-like dinuclear metal center hexameric protein [Candidatus Parcubacteria bacterium]|nr:Nif3-like dinuclear metal center hexameric protein [Candidatus Parcubacteria bacterium]